MEDKNYFRHFAKETKEFKNRANEYDKVKYICNCGHRVIIPSWVDKQLCDWCGNYVFKDKKEEFKYRMEQEIKKGGK